MSISGSACFILKQGTIIMLLFHLNYKRKFKYKSSNVVFYFLVATDWSVMFLSQYSNIRIYYMRMKFPN